MLLCRNFWELSKKYFQLESHGVLLLSCDSSTPFADLVKILCILHWSACEKSTWKTVNISPIFWMKVPLNIYSVLFFSFLCTDGNRLLQKLSDDSPQSRADKEMPGRGRTICEPSIIRVQLISEYFYEYRDRIMKMRIFSPEIQAFVCKTK